MLLARSHWHDHLPAYCKLLLERHRHMRRSRSNKDCIERSRFRYANMAIGMLESDIVDTQLAQVLARLGEQLQKTLDRIHFAHEFRQYRRLIPAAGADLEYLAERLAARQPFGPATNVV